MKCRVTAEASVKVSVISKLRIVVGLVFGLAVIAILLGMRLFRFGRPAIASTSPTEY
jgi:hypothetical protein